MFAAAFLAGLIGAGGLLAAAPPRPRAERAADAGARADPALLRAALDSAGRRSRSAVTDGEGRAGLRQRDLEPTGSAPTRRPTWRDRDRAASAAIRAARRDRRRGAAAQRRRPVHEGEVRLAGPAAAICSGGCARGDDERSRRARRGG